MLQKSKPYLFSLLALSLFACFSNCKLANKEINSLETFQFPEEFQLELVVSEPLISDPVDMEIDEDGIMMVVEMHGYPLDLSGSGFIKELIDNDGDGLPDKSRVFADGLVLPTGIMKWQKGWIVTDPPNVLYFEDTDQDGVADVRDTILTGFARSNPQHNVNNPTYGLDNWIYLAHEGAIQTKQFNELLGDEGDEVRFVNKSQSARLPRNANGLSVRFRPDTGELETLSAKGQYGLAFDDWGHHFVTSNADHLFHIVMNASYMDRNKDLLIPSARHYTPRTGKGFEIHPITTTPDHQLLTDIGVITSACGIVYYNGGLFPAKYNNTIFTAEPVHNLIHVDKILDDGATFESVNLIEEADFLASTDSWFRPVNHYIGPDGAVYILDYYRKIIEHPEWLSDEVIQSGDLTAGTDMGRIYRLTPKGTTKNSNLHKKGMSQYNIDELISLLEHDNIWWRKHAQRLLMDKKESIPIEKLESFISSTKSSVAKIHALWLIEGLNKIDPNIVISALQDSNAGVRENAIKIAETHLDQNPQLLNTLLTMVEDESAKVRFQLLLTLGNSTIPKVREIRKSILLQDLNDPWVQLAALSAKELDWGSMYQWASEELLQNETKEGGLLFKRIIESFTRKSSEAQINKFVSNLIRNKENRWFDPIVLESLGQALSQKESFVLSKQNETAIVNKLQTQKSEDQRETLISVLASSDYFKSKTNRLFIESLDLLNSDDISEEYKIKEAVSIVGLTDPKGQIDLLESTLLNSRIDKVRMASLSALEKSSTLKASEIIIGQWLDLNISERKRAMLIFLKDDEQQLFLLQNIEKGTIQASNLSWSQKVTLLNSSDSKVRPLARSILHGSQLGANELWTQYEPCLSLPGKSISGAAIFKQNCGSCHQIGGKNGVAFGPDLASIQNRNKAALLLDVLQPNRSIADGYEFWMVELNSGSNVAGIISEEGPNTLTIRDAFGKDQTIDRNEIKSLEVSELSAMSEGLHAQISVDEMADLLAYLKKH